MIFISCNEYSNLPTQEPQMDEYSTISVSFASKTCMDSQNRFIAGGK